VVAETIVRLTGYGDTGQVRFVKTGSEACAAAVRLARTVTGRRHLLSSGYHGWSDACLTAPPAWGVPDAVKALTRTFPFNDLALAENAFYSLDCDGTGPVGRIGADDPTIAGDYLAAVIVEPETLDAPAPGFLQGLRDLCTRYGVLLVFDECITAARFPEYTAGRHYGVQPDLTVLSKGLANGYPLACVVGHRDVLQAFDVTYRDGNPVYVSGTWSGEALSLAAAQATLEVWEREQVAAHVTRVGTWLQEQLQRAIQAAGVGERVRVRGHPYRLLLDCPSLAEKTALMARLLTGGQLIGTGFNLMAAHTQEAAAAAVNAMAFALARLDAPPPGRAVVAPYRQA